MASAKRKSKITSNSRDGTPEEEKMERQRAVGWGGPAVICLHTTSTKLRIMCGITATTFSADLSPTDFYQFILTSKWFVSKFDLFAQFLSQISCLRERDLQKYICMDNIMP